MSENVTRSTFFISNSSPTKTAQTHLKESEPFYPYKALLIALSSVSHTADMSCTTTTLLLHYSLISLRKPLQLLDFLRQSVCFTVFSSSRESLSLFLMTLSLATRIHVFMPEITHIATGVLAFIPDSTEPFHWESSYLCLIASSRPG